MTTISEMRHAVRAYLQTKGMPATTQNLNIASDALSRNPELVRDLQGVQLQDAPVEARTSDDNRTRRDDRASDEGRSSRAATSREEGGASGAPSGRDADRAATARAAARSIDASDVVAVGGDRELNTRLSGFASGDVYDDMLANAGAGAATGLGIALGERLAGRYARRGADADEAEIVGRQRPRGPTIDASTDIDLEGPPARTPVEAPRIRIGGGTAADRIQPAPVANDDMTDGERAVGRSVDVGDNASADEWTVGRVLASDLTGLEMTSELGPATVRFEGSDGWMYYVDTNTGDIYTTRGSDSIDRPTINEAGRMSPDELAAFNSAVTREMRRQGAAGRARPDEPETPFRRYGGALRP